ncbi:MAG: PD-(D/E)XK nuclease domain-containing protein, partial [Acetatifactor sp.]|nr:PD-(D/E)XK nuclease domain-containing protein [Acetatifactor sp.]
LSYNDENSLSCVITLAYYSAKKDYTLIRELPTGKGFADLVFLPRKHCNKPALLVELKWNRSVRGAMDQIKQQEYIQALNDYKGDLLLVGINYDKKSKIHQCSIEKFIYEK